MGNTRIREDPYNPALGGGTLTVTGYGSDYIQVSFDALADVSGYEVVWRRASVSNIEDTLETTGTTATITGLLPETEYVINYRGFNAEGVGPFGIGDSATTLKARPADWSWWTGIWQGGEIGITAGEWNGFCERINEFRAYCGLSWYGFTTAVRGGSISAAIVNEAVEAIRDMGPPTAPPGRVTAGVSEITAAFFGELRDALNSI